MKLVPDTSVIVDGRVSARVKSGTLEADTILIPEPVLAELEAQANAGEKTGQQGLTELTRINDLAEEGAFSLEYIGNRPSETERYSATDGMIDAIIRDLADQHEATLVTADTIQRETARAKGIEVEYIAPALTDIETLPIEKFFDEQTMSVHLKVGAPPMAKRGDVGNMRYESIDDGELTESEITTWTGEILDAAHRSSEGFVELDEDGMQIVQFRDYRIAIARPPFADGWEITAVRPLLETDLEDYQHADELKDRLLEHQRGVLIAGAPGAGKTTFAQAVAEFLVDHDYAVKTMEKPRDLQVGPEITQYTALDDQMQKTADSLLMVRPDYTIYDEVRKTEDFEVFADMRLAGVGMIGVVHATRAIDALQRLIGRVELGLIPQVVDTVIFIETGSVRKVYDVSTEVKVPEGLMEEDLARPVIMVADFETGKPEYEIYTFNRQVVTVPLDGTGGQSAESGVEGLARQEVEREIASIAHGPVDVEFSNPNRAVVYVSEDDISAVIGKGGGRIADIEDRLGVDIDVRSREEQPPPSQSPESKVDHSGPKTTVRPEITSQHIIIPAADYDGATVEVLADGEYLFTATVGRSGEIQVSRGSAIANELEDAIDRGREITIVPA